MISANVNFIALLIIFREIKKEKNDEINHIVWCFSFSSQLTLFSGFLSVSDFVAWLSSSKTCVR